MNLVLFMIFFAIIAIFAVATYATVLSIYITNTNVKVSNTKFVYPKFLTPQIIQSGSYITSVIGGQLFSFNYSTTNEISIEFAQDKNFTVGEQFMIDTQSSKIMLPVVLKSDYYIGTDGKPLNIKIPNDTAYFGYLADIGKKIISGYGNYNFNSK